MLKLIKKSGLVLLTLFLLSLLVACNNTDEDKPLFYLITWEEDPSSEVISVCGLDVDSYEFKYKTIPHADEDVEGYDNTVAHIEATITEAVQGTSASVIAFQLDEYYDKIIYEAIQECFSNTSIYILSEDGYEVIDYRSSSSDNYEEDVDEAQEPEAEPDIYDWMEYTMEKETGDGYTFDIHFRLSPWILLSKNEVLANATWNEVASGHEFPEYDDWLIKDYGDGSYGTGLSLDSDMASFIVPAFNDMYYCIGDVEITNTTDGWSITEDNAPDLATIFAIPHGGGTIGRIYYSGHTYNQGGGIAVNPKLTSDHWGPVPFIIMSPEEATPKNPEGKNLEEKISNPIYFKYWDRYMDSEGEAYVGAVDIDGVYHAPEN